MQCSSNFEPRDIYLFCSDNGVSKVAIKCTDERWPVDLRLFVFGHSKEAAADCTEPGPIHVVLGHRHGPRQHTPGLGSIQNFVIDTPQDVELEFE